MSVASVTAEQQITFPVTGYRPVFNAGRTLADRDGVGDSAVLVRLLSVMARTAHHSGAPQMLHQLLLQGAAGLDEEAAIDCLGGHLTARIASLPILGRRRRSQADWSA